MYLLEIKTKPKRTSDLSILEDAFESFGAALMRNRNIYGDFILHRNGNEFKFLSQAPEKNSLNSKNLTNWARGELEKIKEISEKPLKFNLTGRSDRNIGRDYTSARKLYLFTHAFGESSPLVSGTSGGPIPFYYLPIDDKIRDELYFWFRTYIEYDNIWLGSGPLEMSVYKQLADVRSEFNQSGLKLAEKISKQTKKKTYYYLQRYWGYEEGEEDRRCPLCGAKWHIHSNEMKKQSGLAWFNFRCDKCALLSHLAVSFDSKRGAKIGQFAK